MSIVKACEIVQERWDRRSTQLLDFEFCYNKINKSFLASPALLTGINPTVNGESLNSIRLKLILLYVSKYFPFAEKPILSLPSHNDWDTLPVCRKEDLSIYTRFGGFPYEGFRRHSTNGTTGNSVSYDFGPYSSEFSALFERGITYPFGAGLRAFGMYTSDVFSKDEPQQVGMRNLTFCGVTLPYNQDQIEILALEIMVGDYDFVFFHQALIIPVCLRLQELGFYAESTDVCTTGVRLYDHQKEMLKKVFGGSITEEMLCWDGGFSFYTDANGVKHPTEGICDYKVIDGMIRTAHYWDFATVFLNYQSGDRIEFKDNVIHKVWRDIEVIDGGQDADALCKAVFERIKCDFQLYEENNEIFVYTQYLRDLKEIADLFSLPVKPMESPKVVGVRRKIYPTLKLK